MLPHPSTNFEIRNYYQNEPKFNGVYSRSNLSKLKDGASIVNINEHESIGTHLIAFYLNAKNVTYFNSFGVEHISKEIRKFNGNKNITANIYKIQAYDSIMCRCFCTGFIDFVLKGKILLQYTNLFSPNEYKKSDKTILK